MGGTPQYLLQMSDKLSVEENIKNTILGIGAKTGIFNHYLNSEINRSESIAGLKRFIDEARARGYEFGLLE